MNKKLNYSLINITALILLLYFGLSTIFYWWDIFLKVISLIAPFIVGFAVAYALTPLVKWFERKGIKRGLAVLIIIFAGLLFIGGLLVITLPLVYDQLLSLSRIVIRLFNDVGNSFDINFGSFEIKLTDYLDKVISNIGELFGNGALNIVSTSIGYVGKIIVGFIGFVYFLADMEKIKDFVKEFLHKISERSFRYVKTIDDELGNYIHGLLVFMVIQFFEYSLLFLLVGHPNWLLLGVLACITSVIPYFGGLTTNIIAVITATVVSTPVLIGTIVICMIFPQLDGYIISPKVYGKTNNVNPLITIMAVSVGGTLAGVVGIIIALPIYLFVRSTYQFFRKDLAKGMKKIKGTI